MPVDNEEQARQLAFAHDTARAAYFWQVRERPSGPVNEATVGAAPILIAEYDNTNTLHLLSEIVTPPPYIWCIQAYRAASDGIINRWIEIRPGDERVYEHRMRQYIARYPADHPLFMHPFAEDCLIFGRRKITSGVEEVMLIYPEGLAIEFAGPKGLESARNHKRQDEEWLGYQNAMHGVAARQVIT